MVGFLVMVRNRLLYLTDLSIIYVIRLPRVIPRLTLKMIYFGNTKKIERGNVYMTICLYA